MHGAELDVTMGHEAGARLKLTSDREVEVVERLDGNVLRARLPAGWTWVLVVTVGQGSRRAFLLKPGDEAGSVKFGRFEVRGRFVIARKANSAQAVEQLEAECRGASPSRRSRVMPKEEAPRPERGTIAGAPRATPFAPESPLLVCIIHRALGEAETVEQAVMSALVHSWYEAHVAAEDGERPASIGASTAMVDLPEAVFPMPPFPEIAAARAIADEALERFGSSRESGVAAVAYAAARGWQSGLEEGAACRGCSFRGNHPERARALRGGSARVVVRLVQEDGRELPWTAQDLPLERSEPPPYARRRGRSR